MSITEVAFLKREEKSEPLSSPEDDADRDEKEDEVEKQKASLKTLRGEKEAVTGQLLRIEKQRTALNEFADNIVVQAKVEGSGEGRYLIRSFRPPPKRVII